MVAGTTSSCLHATTGPGGCNTSKIMYIREVAAPSPCVDLINLWNIMGAELACGFAHAVAVWVITVHMFNLDQSSLLL
jgi:hypothetical protein